MSVHRTLSINIPRRRQVNWERGQHTGVYFAITELTQARVCEEYLKLEINRV
jgi:hypothetical protein